MIVFKEEVKISHETKKNFKSAYFDKLLYTLNSCLLLVLPQVMHLIFFSMGEHEESGPYGVFIFTDINEGFLYHSDRAANKTSIYSI